MQDAINWTQDAANWAQIISSGLLAMSLGVAIKAIRTARQTQKHATASELWSAHLARAIQYPEFAYPPNFDGELDPTKQEFGKSKRKFEQYEWFVSALLETADEILREFDDSDHRISLVRRNIGYHAKYLKVKWNPDNPEATFLGNFGAQVREIIRSVAQAADNSTGEPKAPVEAVSASASANATT